MNSNQITELLLRHVEAENAHDMERTLATLHSECVFEDVPLGAIYRGHEGAAQHYKKWWDAFGLKFRRAQDSAQHITLDGKVIAEGRFVGRHIGPFEGVAATHRSVEFRFVVIIGFRDQLMAGERFYYDRESLRRQLVVDSLGEPAGM